MLFFSRWVSHMLCPSIPAHYISRSRPINQNHHHTLPPRPLLSSTSSAAFSLSPPHNRLDLPSSSSPLFPPRNDASVPQATLEPGTQPRSSDQPPDGHFHPRQKRFWSPSWISWPMLSLTLLVSTFSSIT